MIAGLNADVIGLQEAEPHLAAALQRMNKWQQFWTQKPNGEPDGCLMLMRPGVTVTSFTSHPYSDGSDHIMQSVVIGGVVFVNTHIKWAPANDPRHAGATQARELLGWLGANRSVVLTDGNDRPNGPVRAQFEAAGFMNIHNHEPTALIGQEQAALDLIAARGVSVEPIETVFRPVGIPNIPCPSDHIPVMAHIEID